MLTTDNSLRFLVSDNITQGVQEVAREPKDPMFESVASVEVERDVVGVNRVCQSYSDTVTPPTHLEYEEIGHLTGSHYNYNVIDLTCVCTTDCRSTCTANVSAYSCADNGIDELTMCHKMGKAVSGSYYMEDEGERRGAECGAGVGCVMKRIPWPCLSGGAGVGITIAGSGVSFTPNGDSPDWDDNFPLGRRCRPCDLL
jgi:hypothetical protein